MPSWFIDNWVRRFICLGCKHGFSTYAAARDHRREMRKDKNRRFHPKCAE